MDVKIKLSATLPAFLVSSQLFLGSDAALADASPLPPSCSSKTGGSSNSLAYSTNGSYECAYNASNGNNSISAWKTESWTSSTAPGYRKQYSCNGQSGSVSISEAYLGSDVGSSSTFTAMNTADGGRHWWSGVLWQTQENGGVASNQYIHDCNGNTGEVRTNFMYITTTAITASYAQVIVGQASSFDIQVSAPYGNGPAQGVVYLYQQKDGSSPSSADPHTDWIIGQGTLDSTGYTRIITYFTGQDAQGNTLTPTEGSVLAYAVMPSNPNPAANPTPTPPQKGWVGSQSGSYGVQLIASSQAAAAQSVSPSPLMTGGDVPGKPATIEQAQSDSANIEKQDIAVVNVLGDGRAPVIALCPKGTHLLNAQAEGDTQEVGDADMTLIDKALIRPGRFDTMGVEVYLPTERANTDVRLQLVCRNSKAGILLAEGIERGTPRADHLVSQADGDQIFAGMGDDDIEVVNAGAIGFGGPGNDRIKLAAQNAVANGGLGNDRIEVTGSEEALIIGGPGRDILVGGFGVTRINALDGKGGDKIVCRSPENRVMADAGDLLKGPCTLVVPKEAQ